MRGLPPFFLLRCFVFLLQFILYACPFVILLAGSKRRAGLNMVSSGEYGPRYPGATFCGSFAGQRPQSAPTVDGGLGIAARNFRAPSPASQAFSGQGCLNLPNPEDPGMHSEVSADTLPFAISPEFPRLPTGSLLNCLPRRGVWRWISWQIKDNPVDSSGANVSSIKKMRRSVRQGAATNRAARFPLLSTPTAAAEIFELGGILCSRAAIVSKRDILPLRAKKGAISSRSDPSDVYALSDDYSALLARNTYRARRRFSRSKSFRIHLLDDSGAF